MFLQQELIPGATSWHFLLALRCTPGWYLVQHLIDFWESNFCIPNLPFSRLSILNHSG